MNKLKISFLLLCVLPFLEGCSLDAKNPPISVPPFIQEEDNQKIFTDYPWTKKENVGFILYDLDTNKVVKQHNRNQTFIPASTTKIFTAAAALKLLGKKHRFKTILAHDGRLSNGILNGNLYLKGDGDPWLTLDQLSEMMLALKKAGIKKINGNFLYDESKFAKKNIIDESMDEDASYNSGLSALSLESNYVWAYWDKGRNKKPLEVFLVPTLPVNGVKEGIYSKKENIETEFHEQGGKEIWTVSPERSISGLKRLPVKNAGLYTAMVFRKLAGIHSIELPLPERGILPFFHEVITVNESKDLIETVKHLLTFSDNIMTEHLLLNIAAESGIKNADMESASQYLEKYFIRTPGNISWKNFHLKNGSGLTSENKISPEQMLGALLHGKNLENDNIYFEQLLPVSGWSYTMQSRLNDPSSAFRVRAKVGAIYYAMALTGYIQAKSGTHYAFAFFITDEKLRAAYEKNPNKRQKIHQNAAHFWTAQNKNFMDEILHGWVENY